MLNLKKISDYAFVFYCSLLQVCKKEKGKEGKKAKKMSDFLKAYISEMAGTIYFRSGRCSVPICRRLHSEFGLVWSRDHGATNTLKIVLCFSYSCCVCTSCFLGLHNTLPCVLIFILWKNIMNMKIWTKWQISVLGGRHIMLPFYLILTRGPIIIVKRYLKGDFKLKDAFWGGF